MGFWHGSMIEASPKCFFDWPGAGCGENLVANNYADVTQLFKSGRCVLSKGAGLMI